MRVYLAGPLFSEGERAWLDAFAARYELKVETVSGADESDMFFPLPRQLRDKEVAA